MSSKSVDDLLYDSAAALRLVDRELQAFRDMDPSPVGRPAAVRGQAVPEGYSASAAEVIAGLGRVRELLHEAHFGVTDSVTRGREP